MIHLQSAVLNTCWQNVANLQIWLDLVRVLLVRSFFLTKLSEPSIACIAKDYRSPSQLLLSFYSHLDILLDIAVLGQQ